MDEKMISESCIFCGSRNISTKVNFCWHCCQTNVTRNTAEESVEETENQSELEEKHIVNKDMKAKKSENSSKKLDDKSSK